MVVTPLKLVLFHQKFHIEDTSFLSPFLFFPFFELADRMSFSELDAQKVPMSDHYVQTSGKLLAGTI